MKIKLYSLNQKEKLFHIIQGKIGWYMTYRKYKKAIELYNKLDKPFWWSEEIGAYYERRGLIKKAMAEYELLINEYIKMKILPLPRGPVELYKLGRWYTKTNPKRAKKYLTLYLRAEKEDCGTGFKIRYKKQARQLLNKM